MVDKFGKIVRNPQRLTGRMSLKIVKTNTNVVSLSQTAFVPRRQQRKPSTDEIFFGVRKLLLNIFAELRERGGGGGGERERGGRQTETNIILLRSIAM